jgi:phosphoribosylformylglycinamidine (FGAM) synthase PurS component
MMTVEVLVSLKVPDPCGFTVFDTLRRRFGLSELRAVHLMRSWELDLTGTPTDRGLDIVRGIMGETALLANPNRDDWTLRPAGGALPAGFHDICREASAFVVKVRDKEDLKGKAMCRIIRERLRIGEVESVRYSMLWILELARTSAGGLDLIRDVSVARSWREGLLSNPHFQDAEVARAEEYLGIEVES